MATPASYGGAAASDLGLGAATGDLETEEEKKKRLLQQQQERMGRSGTSVYGLASQSLFSDMGAMGGGIT